MTRLLVINADDLGYDPAVSAGIVEAMRDGVVSSATLMVNTPHSASAAQLAQGLALGLHFNLARFSPLSTGFPVELLDGHELSEAKCPLLLPKQIEREVEAQLDRFAQLVGRAPTHVDVHRHLHRLPNVLEGLCRVAARRHLPVRSIDEPMRAAIRAAGVLTNEGFVGDAQLEPYWTLERLEGALASVAPTGLTELMCHPGHAPTTVRSGYSTQREVELATFTHPAARRLLERHGLVPSSYAALGQG